MTVPKCKGRVVRLSKAYRYNETGLTQKAFQKIWDTNQKRERRLAKKARSRKLPRKTVKTSAEDREKASGYRRVEKQQEWVPIPERKYYLHPISGELAQDNGVSPPAVTVYRWKSVFPLADIKPCLDFSKARSAFTEE